MNADELRSRRREIVGTFGYGDVSLDEILNRLESLDKAAATPRNGYYEFVNQFDTLYRIFKAAEGRSEALDTTAAMMIAALQRYRETLKTPETESS